MALRRKIDLVLLLLVVIAGIYGATHAQQIGDWWHTRTYHPSDEIVKLADDAGMSETGKRLFYRFEPTLVDQTTLDDKCTAEKLGCTEGRFIYILQPTNEAEYSRAIVTAAHEMLHIAYSRLPKQQQEDVHALLQTELTRPAAESIVKALEGYPQADHDNEAHSFFGSQLGELSNELEQYYTEYFNNRNQTVAAYAASPEQH